MSTPRTIWALIVLAGLVGVSCTTGHKTMGADAEPLIVGAVYPLSGSQGQGGVDEHQGVLLAAQLVDQDGGVNGHSIQIRSVDVTAAEAAPGAVEGLNAGGIDLVLGSYGSTISAPASEAAAERGMLFWETGAVGMLAPASDQGGSTFRIPPTGEVLGASAIRFVHGQLAPTWDREPRTLRYAVSYVDDVYGRSVAAGAIDTLRSRSLRDVGTSGTTHGPRTCAGSSDGSRL